jgi:hypothetical protein
MMTVNRIQLVNPDDPTQAKVDIQPAALKTLKASGLSPAIAAVRVGNETYYGILTKSEPRHQLQIIDLATAPSEDAQFAALEMVVTNRRLTFDSDKVQWRELTPHEWWGVVQAKARESAE